MKRNKLDWIMVSIATIPIQAGLLVWLCLWLEKAFPLVKP